MKKISGSTIINLMAILFLFATFFLQYEHLFVTRIVLTVFSIVYLVIEINKEYFSRNKMRFIFISVVILISLILSILFDTSANNLTNNRVFLIPVFVFTLFVIMYKDLYDVN